MRTIALTILTMIAFAANSVLCRIALGNELIDAATFTTIRLGSGALSLLVILYLKQPQYFEKLSIKTFNFSSSFSLFLYAICFSYAYIEISTGTGALILFGTVQLTMIVAGIVKGEKPTLTVWTGTTLAFGGLVYLILPGVDAPSSVNAILMAMSGFAWAIYTLRGRKSANPIADTTWNFVGTLPFIALTSAVAATAFSTTLQGIILAIASGAIASGMGYAIWYTVLPSLSRTVAAIVQLSVPTIAAFGGVIFMLEPFSTRLILASIATLGGIAMVIYAKRPANKN